MMRKFPHAILGLLLLGGLTVPGIINAQTTFNPDARPSEERSDFEERRKSILDANNLRSTYHNFGFGGRTGEGNRDELYYEYPKNTNRRYIYFISIFTGAEVRNQLEGSDNVFPVVVDPLVGQSPTGDSWTHNPIPGYAAETTEELARSDRGPRFGEEMNTWPATWPDKMDDEGDPGWAGQWNGYFGKGIFNADQEFFYRSGDDLYGRYVNGSSRLYRPDATDNTRGGLGLVMDSRILAWTQNLIADVHFNIFEIRNDASYDYDKVSFMLWTADWVGTPQDDRPYFDQQRSTAFYTDIRPTASPAEFDGTAIGVAGIRFLETPGNAIDGIDNDGDADFYIPASDLYDARNQDLVAPLLEPNGGFFPSTASVTGPAGVTPLFLTEDFQPRTLTAGTSIVLIDEDGNRILTRYPDLGADEEVTVSTQGREITLTRNGPIFPGGANPVNPVLEDTLQARHQNLFDDDFDGLIDENQPNHLTLTRLQPDGTVLTRPVRYINYLYDGFYEDIQSFTDRDTIQTGLVVPNSWIREKIQSDAAFASLVSDNQQMLVTLYADRLPASTFTDYFKNFHTAAPMIDEARDDFFDNNGNWTASADDVGIDGVEGTGSRGEGDGLPSSGAFTGFPGESNIDKTDVAETDAIGITSATFRSAGSFSNTTTNLEMWQTHMSPGRFTAAPDASQDTDQFITSSYFPLRAGAVERFAIAVSIAQANTSSNDADIELVQNSLRQAFNAYEANYQFATAPPPPILRAVPGDGRVTLYWDDEAEFVFDRYLERLGQNPNNFEGYKIYRATDPSLLDARKITDGRGNLQFLKPIAQFDRVNEFSGNHPIDINGVDFYLGDNTGLQRYYIDTDVINGRQYYYAVVAYNHGAPLAGIAPAESPINLSINPDGTLIAGVNVQSVIPASISAGYVGPQPPVVQQTAGDANGDVLVDIVDPRRLNPGSTYRITFNGPDGQDATSYTLTNVTSGEVLLEERESLQGQDSPVIEGFRVVIRNPESVGKLRQTRWTTDSGIGVQATVTAENTDIEDMRSYLLYFGAATQQLPTQEIELTQGPLTRRIPATQTNLRILDANTGEEVGFALQRNQQIPDRNTAISALYAGESQQNFSDVIHILNEQAQVVHTLTLNPHESDVLFRPMPGDQVDMTQSVNFTNEDVFEFTIDASANVASEDADLARERLADIRVVPNPYIVTNIAEQRPTPVRPQQERQLHFINLPAQSTIRIFNVAGQLVQTLQVNNSIENGLYVWDMLTKDNLDLAYGIYIYHVEAPGVGEHTGKFAVIK